MNEETLFQEALSRPAEERAAYLEQACAGRPELRAAVEALLAAYEKPGNLLDRPPIGPAPTVATEPDRSPPGETAGLGDPGAIAPQSQHAEVTIEHTPGPDHRPSSMTRTAEYQPIARPDLLIAGRYTLLEKIGEGGMGEVWVAKQSEPVKRKVALKLIKQGMDSRAVIARFEQERQALAMMDHPNIAKVLDAGLTPTGQPFFVMELVNGAPLTRFCDEMKLTPRERLELFVPICQAVQHAHQKGIVHRDLKPANILITMIDGHPVPKVIDFGVAKATAGKLTDESMSTQFGAVLGTLEYMSPEQAGFSGEDIDTRADIYSLGVILYELLTGLRPIDAARLRQAALTEMIRIIREEEPSKPSTRLSTHESLPSLAAMRQTDPRKLMTMLRGELDWVIMKCLEKNRDRRYETANGLARDIQRYLADEAVEARPPSAGYRFQKFVSRHKGQVIAASLVILALLGGIVGTTYGLLRAQKAATAERLARDDAEAKRAEAEKQKIRAESREQQAIDAVKRFRDAVADNPELKNNPALENLRKSLLKEPLAFFKTLREQLQADQETRPESLYRLARVTHDQAHLNQEIGDREDALRAHDEGLALCEQLVRRDPANADYQSELARCLNCQGISLSETGRHAGARSSLEAAREIRERLAREHPTVTAFAQDLALTHNNLGSLLSATADPAGARSSLEAAREIRERLAREHPTVTAFAQDLATTHLNLGLLLSNTSDPAGARRSYEAAREIFERLARENPTVTDFAKELARTHSNLGNLLSDTGDPAGARHLYEAAREIFERLAREHPEMPDIASGLGTTLNNMATIDLDARRFAEARDRLLRAIEWQNKAIDANPRNTRYRQALANHLTNLITACNGLNDRDGADDAQRQLAELQASDPHLAALDARLDEIANGKPPKDNTERLPLAQRAYDTKRYGLAARLWADALEADPKIAQERQAQHRYNAACAAALAGCGMGQDDRAPDEAAQARLRKQARDWLKSELDAWTQSLDSGPPQARPAIAQTLEHWKVDPDLASIREEDQLAKLPEAERSELQRLWADVDALLSKTNGE